MKADLLSYIIVVTTLVTNVLAGFSNSELLGMAKSHRNKVITLNDQNYQEILGGPRDYHLFVLLTSDSPQINCALCREFKPDFEIVSNSWFKEHPQGVSVDEETPKNIYFLSSEFMESRSFFEIFQLNNIPKVYYFPPSQSSSPKNFINEKLEYQFFSGEHKELVKNWITELTGNQINIFIPPDYSRIIINAVATFVLVVSLKIFHKQALAFISSRYLWSAFSLIAVLLLTTGYMFNQIRGVPYVRDLGNGNIQYIVPGQQNQFGVETQILSFIYGFLSLLVVVLIKKAPEIKSPSIQFITVGILTGLIFVFYSIYLSIFDMKGTGYPYKFMQFF